MLGNVGQQLVAGAAQCLKRLRCDSVQGGNLEIGRLDSQTTLMMGDQYRLQPG